MPRTAGGGPDTGTTPPPGLRYRTVEDDDLPFLAGLYASTRREELAPVPWPEEEKERFLRFQFEAQHRHYREHYPDCAFLVIEKEPGEMEGAPVPVGRLYLDRWEDELRVVDIALLPEHRGRGLGTAILRRVLAEGGERDLPVRIHVEEHNPARSLYHRLGFRRIDTNGVYALLEWTPGDDGAPGGEGSR